jgi:hypothetical protein
VAQDVVIDFNDRSQSALTETGDRSDGELAISRSEGKLVGFTGIVSLVIAQAQIEAYLC